MSQYTLSAVFNLKDKVTDKIGKISKGMSVLDKDVRKLSDKMQKVGQVGFKAFKYMSVGVGLLGVAGTKVAMDFETLSARMDTAFKGDKKKAMEYYAWANKFANKTPFSNEEVIGVTAKLSLQGYDPKKVMKSTNTNLLELLGDMAGSMGVGLDQAYEAFDDVSRGEWMRLKTLGIDKSEIEKTITELAKTDKSFIGAISNNGAIVKKQKVMDALVLTINKKYKGGMDNLAKTMKGKLSTTVGNFKFAVGKAFGVMEDGTIKSGSAIDRLKGKLDKINAYFESDKFQTALTKWSGIFSKALGQMEVIAKKFVEYFQKNMPNTIGAIFDKMNDFDGDDINKALDGVIKNFDSVMKSAMRATNAIIGFQLGAKFGLKGALIGATLGLASPEIMQGIDYIKGLMDEEDKAREDLIKKAKETQNIEVKDPNQALGYLPGASTYGNKNIQPVPEKKIEVKIDISDIKLEGGLTLDQVNSVFMDMGKKIELGLTDKLMLGGGI